MAILESITLELKSLRYLINNVVVLLSDIKELLNMLLQKEGVKVDRQHKQKKADPIKDGIKFDMFTLKPSQYNALIQEFGYDIMCRACAMLDDYIRDRGYIPYGNAIQALKKIMIIHALKEKLDSQKVGVVTYKDVDTTAIETKQDAIAFINSVPPHVRNIDKSVQELLKRFDITL